MPSLLPSLVISIINYKTGELTLKCVRSVLDNLEGVEAQIIVVDNNSEDGSAEQIENWIKTQNPKVPVRMIRSTNNKGFSAGHNLCMAVSESEYYLLLNSDCVLRNGFFTEILAAVSTNTEAGLFAPCIEFEDGSQQISCFRFPSPVSEFIRGACSGPVSRLLSRYDVPLSMPPAADKIGWASFACILLRGSMVEEIGPMDEGYFLYFEDAEYCWRARKAGWRISYVPDARLVHFRGGSGPVKALQNRNKRLPTYYYSSRTRFFSQAYGWAGLLTANFLWVLGRGLANSRLFLGKSVPKANEGEIRDIWTNILSPQGASWAPTED